MGEPIAVRGKWYDKDTRRFLGDIVPGQPAPGREDLTAGSVQDVVERVGDDEEKARKALAQEQTKEKPRSTLVEKLSETLDDEDQSDG